MGKVAIVVVKRAKTEATRSEGARNFNQERLQRFVSEAEKMLIVTFLHH